MIRPEFFERKDLTAAQRCFLEFLRAFFNTLGGAADAFEKDLPDAVLQTAHRTAVIDELAQSAMSSYTFRSGRETKQFFDALFLARSGAEVLRRLCTSGAEDFTGLDDSRAFLGSLCRCVYDRIDWSHRRQLLGSQHHGAEEDDLELTIRELPASMAAEHRVRYAQALIDFHDALLAARDLFEVMRRILSTGEELFPLDDEKYWQLRSDDPPAKKRMQNRPAAATIKRKTL